MDKKTYEALKTTTKETRLLIKEKWGHRKRLNQNELFREAVLYRDIVKIENWIDEVAKEYEEKIVNKCIECSCDIPDNETGYCYKCCEKLEK